MSELAGNLGGADLETARQAWQRATATDALKPVIVDITFISGAGEQGRALLAAMHRFCARIVAESPSLPRSLSPS